METTYLHGGDVCVGYVAVDVLDLGQALLGHLDQLGPRGLVQELGGAGLLRGRLPIVVPVLLEDGHTHTHTHSVQGTHSVATG